MYDCNDEWHGIWLDDTYIREGGTRIITHETDSALALTRIERMMVQLVQHDGDLVDVCGTAKNIEIVRSPLVKVFSRCLYANTHQVKVDFPKHRFSPYFELFHHTLSHMDEAPKDITIRNVSAVNALADQLRSAAKANEFTKVVENQARGARKNFAHAKAMIDDLFEKNSREVVIRIDLHYRGTRTGVPVREHVSPKELVRDRKRILAHLKRRFRERLHGYIWKQEHGAYRGHHLHMLIFLDGHAHQNDVSLAKMLGEHWKNVITLGRGSYWNCNAHKDYYSKLGILGIGRISYDDVDLRAGLLNALKYMCKIDVLIRLNAPEIVRIFGKSMVRLPAIKRGRPRA